MKKPKLYKVWNPAAQSAAKGLAIELARGADARQPVIDFCRAWVAWFAVVAAKSSPKIKAPVNMGPAWLVWWDVTAQQSESYFAARNDPGFWLNWPLACSDDWTTMETARASGPTGPVAP